MLDTLVETPNKMGRPKKQLSGDEEKPAVVAVRGSRKWHEWLLRLADFRRLRTTDLIDQALVEYAERHGFGEPPPKR